MKSLTVVKKRTKYYDYNTYQKLLQSSCNKLKYLKKEKTVSSDFNHKKQQKLNLRN